MIGSSDSSSAVCDTWEPDTHYTINDKVLYNGQGYECTVYDVWFWPPTDTRYWVTTNECDAPPEKCDLQIQLNDYGAVEVNATPEGEIETYDNRLILADLGSRRIFEYDPSGWLYLKGTPTAFPIGNVGIGTTNPTGELHIWGAGSNGSGGRLSFGDDPFYNVYIGDTPGGPWKRLVTYDVTNNILGVKDEQYDPNSGAVVNLPSAFGNDGGTKYNYTFTKDYNGYTLANGRTYYVAVTSYGFNLGGTPKILESSKTENLNLFW